jgi:hypothetical protein
MRSNFLNFTKMQVSALSQIVHLQLLCIVLFPVFFSQINVNNDFANVLTYTTGLLMLSYLLLRNFAFNDAKYKTRLLFSILPITPNTVIGARGIVIYLFCIFATPLLILFSNITHAIKPEMFAVIQPHILPYGLLLVSTFIPMEFSIFYIFEAQKADIIGALALLPYMGLVMLFYNYLLKSHLWIILLIIAVFTNVICYLFSVRMYHSKAR